MTTISAPFGLRCVFHPSGEPRIATLENGIASGYATGLYNGTPVKLNDDGHLVETESGPDVTIGIFAGCFFIKNGVPQTLPNWPAGQTYDPDTPMWAQYETLDADAIYEAQANGPVAQIKLGETINLVDSSTGSSSTGQSTQRLNAATTGITPGTFVVQNIAPYSDNDWGDPFTIVRVRISSYQPTGNWPWPDADLLWDMDFTGGVDGDYMSGSLGVITSAQAIATTRGGGTAYVFDGDGLLQAFAINTSCLATGRGLWAQTSGSCRLDFNNALDNAAWTKTGLNPVQDYPSPFSVGTPAGWRITASAPNAVITQPYTTITAGGTTTMSLPHGMFYWDGTPLSGAIEITQDNFVTVLDIRPWLVAGKWVQIGGTPGDLPIPPVVETFGVRIVASGDSVGFCLGSVERGYVMTTPILTPGAGTVNRGSDVTEMITANFPPLWDKEKFTILMVNEPGMRPLPPFGSTTMPRTGWTGLEINNPYNITMSGIGTITANVMTVNPVPAPDPANAAVGNRMVVGTGVSSRTDITAMSPTAPYTGTGGDGTYLTETDLDPSQDTETDIVLQSRLEDAQGWALNAALKPDDDFAQRIGVTVTAEPLMQDFGNDPQTVDYVYNEPNAEGWTVDTTLAGTASSAGFVALKGDTEPFNPVQFTHAPQLNSSIVISIGHQYPSGGPLDGVVMRFIAINRQMTQTEISAATLLLQRWAERRIAA